MNSIFGIIFTLLPIIVLGVFIFVFSMMFSPKLRSKMLGSQVKTLKYMIDENEDLLRDLNMKNANLQKEALEIRSRAVNSGFGGGTTYCKYCGASIDYDSLFCKRCGKRQ